jgi:hypothetical protein
VVHPKPTLPRGLRFACSDNGEEITVRASLRLPFTHVICRFVPLKGGVYPPRLSKYANTRNDSAKAQDPANSTSNLDSTAIKEGASLFRANCSPCHGLNARGGGRGPDLTSARWRHDPDETRWRKTVNFTSSVISMMSDIARQSISVVVTIDAVSPSAIRYFISIAEAATIPVSIAVLKRFNGPHP